jgi:hypothetical protein
LEFLESFDKSPHPPFFKGGQGGISKAGCQFAVSAFDKGLHLKGEDRYGFCVEPHQ